MYIPKKYVKRDKPYKFLTLSFDDGVKQDIRFIQLLDKYGVRCTFNLNSGLFGLVHDLVTPGFTVDHSEVEREKVAEVYSDYEVAVHTLTHPRLDLLQKEEIIREVGEDRNALEKITGQNVFGMAYPGGPFFNDFVIDTIVNNTSVRYSRTTNATKNFSLPERLMEWNPSCHWRDDDTNELIERFIASQPNEDILLYIWGHSYEFDIYNAWEDIENILSRISGHGDITYATNGEIAEYIINNTETK